MKRTVEQLKKDFPELWKLMEKAKANNLLFDNGHDFYTPNYALKRWQEGYVPEVKDVKLVSRSVALKKLRKLRAEYQGWVREVDKKIKEIEKL